ncbi:uncharacterized protein LOC118333848 [Morone saxatilis]|uniref:uncharacterized protein LOC118333848 n=1 Tax=Morone saxatilis TaxID=34816 RepID=UPI0015E2524A|nr:uncharacterized protein LOC118333848 [Morone saxatilis]
MDRIHEERPNTPETRCASSDESYESDHSRDPPLIFKDGHCPPEMKIHEERQESTETSCVSMKSDQSREPPLVFKDGCSFPEMKTDQTRSEDPTDDSAQPHKSDLDSIFMVLEENIVTFVKNELKKFKRVLSPDDPKCLEKKREDEDVIDTEEEEEHTRRSREAFLKITLNFLRRMKQDVLADCLQSSKRLSTSLKFDQRKNGHYISKMSLNVFQGRFTCYMPHPDRILQDVI